MLIKNALQDILESADIKCGGERTWDVQVHDTRVFSRVLARGTLGAGESYMDGWWEVPKLDEFFYRVGQLHLQNKIRVSFRSNLRFFLSVLGSNIVNRQSTTRAFYVAEKHYNIGNDLYTRMLDPWLQYSCGYWDTGAKTLAEAQETKLDIIARKLMLKPGMRVLDVGCGWGGLAKFLADHYGVEVTGITVSTEQAKYAAEWVQGSSVEIKVSDYRTFIAKPFDRIVSVGMFEHVGHKNHRIYMEHISRLLTKTGIFLLHTIGRNDTAYTVDQWMDTYIFPNALLPSPTQIAKSIENIFVLEDWHNFGINYYTTLMAWYENFNNAWPELSQSKKYDARFYRMWKYYLLSCAGLFRARSMNLWQLVLTKDGLTGGYKSIR